MMYGPDIKNDEHTSDETNTELQKEACTIILIKKYNRTHLSSAIHII